MIPIINRYTTAPVLSLLLARIFYSINWFNIGSTFYFIAVDFGQEISMLGLITASFFVGVGLFQVPAGILAAKYGPRNIAIYGILIASSAALLSGLSSNILQMAALRFIVGMGMACFFGSSVILISKYLGERSEGLGIGLINSAHAIGGIVGIFAWVILAQVIGWRISIVLSGALGLVTGLLLIIVLSRQKEKERITDPDFRIKLFDIGKTLFSKSLIILGLTLLAFQAGSSITLTFIVFYLIEYLKLDPVIAGFIGSLNLIMAFLFSPIFGRIYDRMRHTKGLLFTSGAVSALSILGLAIPSLYIILPSMLISAIFLSAGFIIVYAEAKRINSLHQHPQYQTLAVSFVNGISLFGGFWTPIAFSFVATQFGYTLAWLLGGVLVILLILPIFKLKDNNIS